MKITAEGYQKCDICAAPYRKPLSDGWTAVMNQIGTKTYVVIHRPGCPAGWRPPVKEQP